MFELPVVGGANFSSSVYKDSSLVNSKINVFSLALFTASIKSCEILLGFSAAFSLKSFKIILLCYVALPENSCAYVGRNNERANTAKNIFITLSFNNVL